MLKPYKNMLKLSIFAFMPIKDAYNSWAETYDSQFNKTRDLEAKALREMLHTMPFNNCLEIGCGTGKNTQWFIANGKQVTGVDLSEAMLMKAKEKIISGNATFIQADITKEWSFINKKYDLISFSLVLEHIENLDHIFKEAAKLLNNAGKIYIGELHPFKQYGGSKARFETATGTQVVECYTHHITNFTKAATAYGLTLMAMEEYFDDDNRNEIPRVLAMVFKKL
jgi:ubiquinone/menaquinone biosynthesis C-methylase UbiE